MHAAGHARETARSWANAPVASLLGITFLVFSPSLGSSFHLDDVTLFSDPVVTSGSGWWYMWRPLQTRPLTYFTFWLNYQLGGQNAAGYHAVNIALHLIAVWLLYRLIARLSCPRVAIIAAVLFALHPIQVEPVAYVFERATLLAAVFCLLSAHAWLDGNYVRATGLFVFALLSKEECAAFPFFLFMIRPVLRPALAMLCLSVAAGVRVIWALESLGVSGAGSRAGIAPLDYFTTQGTVIWRYLRMLVVPYGFTCDPDITVVRDWRGWLAWVALIGVAALAWKLHPYGRWFAAGLVLLAPSSSIFPAEDLAADRRVYLPMVVFAYLAGLLLQRVRRPVLLLVSAVALAALSANRAQVWRSEQKLWAEAVQRAPGKLRPRVLLSRASDMDTALRLLDEAQKLAPNDARPRIEKGVRLLRAGLPDIALIELEAALKLAPEDPVALNNYGIALSALGRRDDALEALRHALRLNPCLNTTRTNLERLGVTAEFRCK